MGATQFPNLTLEPEPDKYSPSLTILMLTAFTSQKPLNHNCDSYLGYFSSSTPINWGAELTNPLFRNLIAFEQCYHHHSHEITSYAFFMNKLVASSKDMEILCEKWIIDNWLSADQDGANHFSKLCNDTVLRNFYYDELYAQVKMHYQIKWYRWLEKLNRDYFANPWSAISLIAAAILLALTVVRKVYAIHSK
ncbi:unnamed protein product [Prunus armeniaca]